MAKLLLNANGKVLMKDDKVYKAPNYVDIPQVTNIQLSEQGYLSFECDTSSLSEYNPTISYLINVNGTEITSSVNTNIRVFDYLVEGQNTISIITKALLNDTSNSKQQTTEYSMPTFYVIKLTITLPKGGDNLAITLVGTDIYIMGFASQTIYKFDTTNNGLEGSTILPMNFQSITICSVGTNIYLFGGYASAKARDTIYKFDTTTKTLTTLSATLPVATYSISGEAIGTNIYLFGGYSTKQEQTIYKFDTTTETITTLSTILPVGLSGVNNTALIGNDIYYYCCKSGHTSIYKFDTTTETITTLNAKCIDKLYNTSVESKGNFIYVFGGYINGASNVQNTIYRLDVINDTIEKLDIELPYKGSEIAPQSIGTNIYLFGGYGGSGNSISQFISKAILP